MTTSTLTNSGGSKGKYSTFPKNNSDSFEDLEPSFERAATRLRSVTRIITVEPALVLYYAAFMAATPLQIQYINYRVRRDLNVSEPNMTSTNVTGHTCGGSAESAVTTDSTEALVQSQSAMYLTLITLSALIPSLFTTILLGAYSDQAGRKYALVPTVLGEIFRVFICILVTGTNLPLWVLCIGLIVQGLTGGAPAFMMSCFSYIADVTSLEKRALRIFIVELAMGIGQMLAQVAIGEAIANLGYFYTFIIIIAIHIVNLMYILFILPETLIKSPDSKLFTLEHYRRTLGLYFSATMKGKRLDLSLGLLCIAACSIIGTANSETITLFLVNNPLCWASNTVGYYNATVYAIRIVGSFAVLTICKRRVSILVLAMVSFVSYGAYDFVIGLATQTSVMFVAAAVGFAAAIGEPMIRTFTSKEVDKDVQGALFSSQAWVSMFCALVGALMFNGIYSAVPSYPGAVFLVAAAFYLIPFTLSLVLYIRSRRKHTKEGYEPVGTGPGADTRT